MPGLGEFPEQLKNRKALDAQLHCMDVVQNINKLILLLFMLSESLHPRIIYI